MRPLNLFAAALLASATALAQTPVISDITNYRGDHRLCPGGVAQVYGTWPVDGARNFTVTVGSLAGSVNVSWINRGVPVELDILIPPDTPVGDTTIVISHLGTPSNAFPVTISPFDPLLSFDSFFTFYHQSGNAVNPTSPAAPGELITTFMNGLGVTSPNTLPGALITSFVPAATTPVVTLAGQPVAVQYAGLYPNGHTGSYQVNFTVPASTGSGPQPVVVTSGGAASNTQALFVGTQPLPAPPVATAALNAASFSTKEDISPGSIVAVFSNGLGTVDNLNAFPATTVNGISVLINGKLAPIFHLIASAGQINVLMPTDADMSASLNVVVQNQNGPGRGTVQSGAKASPASFQVADPTDSTRHNAVATIANTAWLIMPATQAAAVGLKNCAGLNPASVCGQPAHPGDLVQLYTTGLGRATPGGDPNGAPLPTGQVAPPSGTPLYQNVVTPTVTVGGIAAKVLFAGQTPGTSGLYQINLQVPANAPVGNNVALQISTPQSVVDTTTLALVP